MALPLMPKATAVWLVDNTALTFEQIAAFCGMHNLEVKGIADGDVATGIVGYDPVANKQLSQEELDKAIADPKHRMMVSGSTLPKPVVRSKGPRYTPIAKRQDKPDAIAFLVRNHAELKDAAIIKLIGTTKNTITAIRERTHWNYANLNPRDPVLLGLCSQVDFNAALEKAEKFKVGGPVEEDQPSTSVLIPEGLFSGSSSED